MTEEFSSRLNRYARLLVRAGVNIQPGQELVVSCGVTNYDFVERVVAEGYAAGAGHVTVLWGYDPVMRLEYEHMPLDYYETLPAWKVEQLNSLAEAGAAWLWLDDDDPNALAGIDPAKPAARARATNTQCTSYRHGMDFGENSWCIAGVPSAAWARTVFPDAATDDEAVARLWDAILDVARVTDNPVAAWEAHDATFRANLERMNAYHFDALHYTSANGTDLTIGMTDKHHWDGGSGTLAASSKYAGTRFFPNVPTEEVFTSPDRLRADGIVYAALPLIHRGARVEDFWFRFEGGAVVDYDARIGRDVLTSILETDENAVRLGECALISKNTPIRQLGILFYNTLFDENASCHLALGTGFPECYEGGLDLDVDELLARGVNHSATHVDFMIGAEDLAITGIQADGTEVPVFVNGQWAWE